MMTTTTLTMHQYQTLRRALALAHKVVQERNEPDRVAPNAMEAADYFNLYGLLLDNPVVTIAPVKRKAAP